MNQQRSRRFRASKESVEKIKEIDRIREELMSRGCEVPPPKPKEDHFDSNCITPVSMKKYKLINGGSTQVTLIYHHF